jgi:hypothetical protein
MNTALLKLLFAAGCPLLSNIADGTIQTNQMVIAAACQELEGQWIIDYVDVHAPPGVNRIRRTNVPVFSIEGTELVYLYKYDKYPNELAIDGLRCDANWIDPWGIIRHKKKEPWRAIGVVDETQAVVFTKRVLFLKPRYFKHVLMVRYVFIDGDTLWSITTDDHAIPANKESHANNVVMVARRR